MASRTHQALTTGLALALLAACAGKPPSASLARRPAAASAHPSGAPATALRASPTAPPLADGLVAPHALGLTGKVKGPAGIVSDNGGGIISNNGSTIVSDNGGGVISNNGSSLVGKTRRQLLALAEVPLAGVPVTLETAAGDPVLDAKGQPYRAVTGPDGSYAFDFTGSSENLVVRVSLGSKGALLAFTPKDAQGAREVDVNTVSTLVMGYILDQYVKGRQTILERLPGDVEAQTRATFAAAVTAAPDDFTPKQVVARVDQLRAADPGVNDQMEKVKRLLLAGLSNQGIGQPVTDVEVNGVAAAVDPITGELVFADANSQRVYKKDADGKLAVVAGNGDFGSIDRAGAPEGVPATQSPLFPMGLVFGPDGTLYVGDLTSGRIRKIDRAGTITTFAKFDGLTAIRDLDWAPDGTMRIATNSALYAADTSGKLTLLAGQFTPYDPFATTPRPVDSSPAAPAAARFTDIQGIGVDPKSGDIYVFDSPGLIRRVTKDQVTTVAGHVVPDAKAPGGYAGDGGPALDALFAATGDVVVDPTGALVVSDGINNRLRRIANGTVTTIAGDGTMGIRGDGGDPAAAQIALTTKLSYAPDGALVICGDGLIRRIADGKITTPVGELQPPRGKRPASQVQLAIPGQLLYEPETNSLLVQEVRHLLRWTLDDNQMEVIAAHGPAGGPFVQGAGALDPYMINMTGLWKRPDGTIGFVATTADGKPGIFELKDAHLNRIAGGLTFAIPAEPGVPIANLWVPPDAQAARIGDTVYIGGKKDGVIYAIRPDGTAKVIAGLGGPSDPATAPDGSVDAMQATFNGITSLAAGPDGRLYVGQLGFIDAIDVKAGRAQPVAGNGDTGEPVPGTGAQAGSVGLVSGLAWDAAGRLYFASGSSGQVFRIDAAGKLLLVAGKGGPNLAGPGIDNALSFPLGLAFDKLGDLFVADDVYHQVKMIPAAKLP